MNTKEKCGEAKTALKRVIAKRIEYKDGVYRLFLLMEDKRIKSFLFEKEGGLKTGDIYLGRAVDHAKNINALYLDIGRDEKVYMQSEDGRADRKLRLLRVVSLPHGNKLARVSEKLKLSAEEETAIRDKAEHMPGCGLLKSGVDMIAESLDFLGEGTDGRWLTEDSVLYEEAVGIVKDRGLKNVSPELYADKDVSLDLLFDVRKRLSDITADRVYLPSGGEIVISPTEAMYVVDVNTFKMTSGKDREQTFLKTNLEAAEVLAWQIAARNMAGIIIVDMINMKADENVTILLEKMKEYLKGTNPQAQVADVTKLGLIEITRKRKGLSIYEIRHILDSTILI